MEKELQRLREELKNKQSELQLLQVQKVTPPRRDRSNTQARRFLQGGDEAKIQDREETIRQLKDEIRTLNSKNTVLEEKYFNLRSVGALIRPSPSQCIAVSQSNQSQSPSPQRREAGVKELLKENNTLRAENEQLVRESPVDDG